MPDLKSRIVTEVEGILAHNLTSETISMVSVALIKVLSNYDVTEICREVIPYDTLNETLLKRYCACLFVDGKAKSTAYQYRRTCQKLAECIGKNFPDMDAYDIRYFLATEKSRGLSDRSVENTRANISAFFQWLTNEDVITKNPCASVNPVKYPDLVKIPFSDVEIDALREACQTKRERALVEFLLTTGVRVAELSSMKVGDIDRTKLSVHVRCGKGGKGRIVYTTPVAMRHLMAYWDERKVDSTAVFLNEKRDPLKPGGVRHVLNKIGDRAKVANVHPHRFRRTLATGLADRGMDIQKIQMWLGHSNINTTMEYVYTSESNISSAYRQHIA